MQESIDLQNRKVTCLGQISELRPYLLNDLNFIVAQYANYYIMESQYASNTYTKVIVPEIEIKHYASNINCTTIAITDGHQVIIYNNDKEYIITQKNQINYLYISPFGSSLLITTLKSACFYDIRNNTYDFSSEIYAGNTYKVTLSNKGQIACVFNSKYCIDLLYTSGNTHTFSGIDELLFMVFSPDDSKVIWGFITDDQKEYILIDLRDGMMTCIKKGICTFDNCCYLSNDGQTVKYQKDRQIITAQL